MRRWRYKEAPVEWTLDIARFHCVCILLFLGAQAIWSSFGTTVSRSLSRLDWACIDDDSWSCQQTRSLPWNVTHIVVGTMEIVLAALVGLAKIPSERFELLLCFVKVLHVGVSVFTSNSGFQFDLFIGIGIPEMYYCLVLCGVRMLPFLACVGTDTMLIAGAAWYGKWVIRMPMYSFFTILCSFVLLLAQQTLLCKLYDAQQVLQVEKEASEALLSMLCDAKCWLADDGATIVQGDSRLDAIMGMRMHGKRLDQHISELDWRRLSTIVVDMGPPQEHPTPVMALTISMKRPAAPAVDVDLFLVDRRADLAQRRCRSAAETGFGAGQGPDLLPGFLLGLRLCVPSQASDWGSPELRSGGCDVRSMSSWHASPLSLPELPDLGEETTARNSRRRHVTVTSYPSTLSTAQQPAAEVQTCSRYELERALHEGEGKLAASPHAKATLLAALCLICDHARGGALICIAEKKAFKQVFHPECLRQEGTGGCSSCREGEPVAASCGPSLRTSDGDYMTKKLQRIHIADERFATAFADFTEHAAGDRWPEDHPDAAARGQPKDGAFLVNTSGYRLKCAVKVLGLPPPRSWGGVGTKHEAALACAWAIPASWVLVRSDAGTIHFLFRRDGSLHVQQLDAIE